MRRPSLVPVCGVLGVVAAMGGCQIERLFPDRVGAGAARLTVRNAAVLAKIVDDDTTCGFSSPQGKAAFVVDGEVGQVGTVTWTITACVLELGKPHVVNEDCHGVSRSAGGRVTIDAVRTVRGILTGNDETPVVPLTNDAVTVAYEANVEDFIVLMSDSASSVQVNRGHLSFAADVHLAVSESRDVCSIDTADVTIRSLKATGAHYTIDNEGSVFDVEVPTLAVSAQLGRWGDTENTIAGSITVWDAIVDVGADPVLDPAYDRATFEASFACQEDLKVPVDYACPDLGTTVVNGAARLLVSNVANLVQVAVADTRCGFSSPAVLAAARRTGEIGRPGGEVAFTIDAPCTIELPEATVIGQDCLGERTVARGRASIRGTMRQRGRLTGDPLEPVLPESRDAITIDFDVDFDDESGGWRVMSAPAGAAVDEASSFAVSRGGLTGSMSPRLAKDTSLGACALPTPTVALRDLVIKPGTAGLLRTTGLAIAVAFVDGALTAQAGDRDGFENRLDGRVTVDVLGQAGRSIDVSGPLDPDYDAATARAAWACTEHLEVPTSDADCAFGPVLAENIGRLAIQTAGTLASLINGDDVCGFEDATGVLLFPSDVEGDSGELGSMSWDVAECAIPAPSPRRIAVDCAGTATWVEGDATFVDVGRTVRGEREKKLFVIDSIIPRDPAAVDVFLREVALDGFATYTIPAGADEPPGLLTIHTGVLSAEVHPALGARADDPGVVDVPTPVAFMTDVRLTADATLVAQGKTFHVRIDATDLTATNGRFRGEENVLRGSVSLDGVTYALDDVALNPDYQAAAFEEAYVCDVDLAGPVR